MQTRILYIPSNSLNEKRNQPTRLLKALRQRMLIGMAGTLGSLLFLVHHFYFLYSLRETALSFFVPEFCG